MSLAAAASKGLPALYDRIGTDKNNTFRILQDFMSSLAASLPPQMGITDQAAAPITLLDNACGLGVFTQMARAALPKGLLAQSSFLCADNNAAQIEKVKKLIEDEGWNNTEAKVLDAMNTGLPADSYSHAALTLALHLIPDPDAVVKDCMRVLRPEGVFGATTFHNDQQSRMWYPDVKSAFASLPFEGAIFPQNVPLQMHDSGDWTNPEWIEAHLKQLGLQDVQVNTTLGSYHFEDANHFMTTFGGMLGWVTNAWWSEETRVAHPVEEVTELVRKHLEEKHGGEGWDISFNVISMTGRVEK